MQCSSAVVAVDAVTCSSALQCSTHYFRLYHLLVSHHIISFAIKRLMLCAHTSTCLCHCTVHVLYCMCMCMCMVGKECD